MNVNIENLLTPIRDDMPCGDNLEYDFNFVALEQACNGKVELQFGDTIVPAELPDWLHITDLVEDLLKRTRDIRLLIILCEAWTRTKGLSGCAEGLVLLKEALRRYWLTIHPAFSIDGEIDQMMRISALAALGSQFGFIRALHDSWLINNSTGDITLRDAIALIDGSKTEVVGFPGGLTRLREMAAQPNLHNGIAIREIKQQIDEVNHFLAMHMDVTALPDLTVTSKWLALLLPIFPEKQDVGNEMIKNNVAPVSVYMKSQHTFDWKMAEINSSDEAELMIDKIIVYFQTYQPSHPAPVMLKRVQRIIRNDFLEIINDLIPEAVPHLKALFGQDN